jgi:FHA domain
VEPAVLELDPEQIVPWIQHGKRCVELREGRSVIGRALDNAIVVDDLQVSRRHAEILVEAGTATLRDLGSANGVRVNGVLVGERRALASGDVIRIGRWDLRFRQTARRELGAQLEHRSRQGETLKEGEVRGEGEASGSQRSLEILGDLSTKSLALGRVDNAERLLAPVLTEILHAALAGQSVALSRAERAASLALRLAEARGEARWVHYVIELYTELGRPLPETIIDQLYALRRGMILDHDALRRYLGRLRERQDRFSPNERFALHRLEGLARMLAP